jgi:hypothetical protein
MIRIDWAAPKITVAEFEQFLSPYLGSNYDGILLESPYLYVRTFEPLTGEQETYIYDYVYSLNDKITTIVGEVTPKTIKNEHCMQPWGCDMGYFESKGDTELGDFVCEITLSDPSVDNLTFTYNSNCPITPTVGNYVFQRHNERRSWTTAVDTVNNRITFERPVLKVGTGIYTRGYYIDSLIRDWKPIMYLWGLTLNVIERDSNGVVETNPCEDFIELSIVDKDDLFKMNPVCQALFGVDAADAAPYLTALGFEDIGEYGHWTKYYDESWVLSCNGKYTKSPDGAPGELLPGLYLRMSFFSTENELHKYSVLVDYYPTSKD